MAGSQKRESQHGDVQSEKNVCRQKNVSYRMCFSAALWPSHPEPRTISKRVLFRLLKKNSLLSLLAAIQATSSFPVFLPGKSHGQRSLVGQSLQGLTESDTTEHVCHARLEGKYFSLFGKRHIMGPSTLGEKCFSGDGHYVKSILDLHCHSQLLGHFLAVSTNRTIKP